jgi:hypothetical protein
MALVASLLTDVSLLDSTLSEFIVDGSIAYSGSYPTNGDTLDLSQLSIPSSALPRKVEIYEATPAPGQAFGASFLYLPGTTLANGLMEIFNGTTQETTGTYASIFGSVAVVLKFRAWVPSYTAQ